VGEVDLAGKLTLLDTSDVLCVPTAYAEAKGLYVLEALARGIPVVLPSHGSFPELVERTGGGVLVPPGNAKALGIALAQLLRDPVRRGELGAAGHASVTKSFTDQEMARGMLEVYSRARSQTPLPTVQ
jgi:glycosyltransferase involved in cell wall biosynthesis